MYKKSGGIAIICMFLVFLIVILAANSAVSAASKSGKAEGKAFGKENHGVIKNSEKAEGKALGKEKQLENIVEKESKATTSHAEESKSKITPQNSQSQPETAPTSALIIPSSTPTPKVENPVAPSNEEKSGHCVDGSIESLYRGSAIGRSDSDERDSDSSQRVYPLHGHTRHDGGAQFGGSLCFRYFGCRGV